MIGVFVTFSFGDDFDEAALRRIAEGGRGQFEGLPELRSKAFTIDSAGRRAVNFYIWESENAAREFFSEAVIEHVTQLYGVRPRIAFVEVAALADNGPATGAGSGPED